MSAPVLRAASPGDARALTAILNQPGVRRGTLRLPHTGEDWIGGVIARPAAHVLVAEVEGAVVGAGALLRQSGRRGHVGELMVFVHEDHWGRGIASGVMTALIDLADNWMGLARLTLGVSAGNPRAIRLYEHLGFEHEGCLRGDSICEGRFEDTLLMARLHPAPRTPCEALDLRPVPGAGQSA